MLSFKSFLTEIKFGGDFRTDKSKPFVASYKTYKSNPDSKYDSSTNTRSGGPMHLSDHRTTFHDVDAFERVHGHNAMPAEQRAHVDSGNLIKVDPTTKTVHLDNNDINHHNHRRPNTTLANFKSKTTRTTPIVYGGIIDLPDHEVHKVLTSIHKQHPIHDYTLHGDPRHEGKTVKEYLSRGRGGAKQGFIDNKPIDVYHGTSTNRAKEIMKTGLKAGNREHHYVDLVKGYSEHNVYVSTHPREASNYATREAINDGSQPVILKTQIHPKDFGKIRNDEDIMHRYEVGIHDGYKKKLRAKYPHITDKDTDVIHYHSMTKGELIYNKDGSRPGSMWASDTVRYEKSAKDPSYTGRLEPHDIPAGHTERSYRQQMGKDFVDAFHKSRRRVNSRTSIAYTGHIKPQHIQTFKTWKKKSITKDTNAEYDAAMTQMKSSIKDKLK
jgi:hypothetical protein